MSGPAHEPVVTGVTGGSHGMTVACDHALELARDYDAAAGRLREHAAATGRVLLDRDLLASAPLSPSTFASAEAGILAATAGPHGLLPAALAW